MTRTFMPEKQGYGQEEMCVKPESGISGIYGAEGKCHTRAGTAKRTPSFGSPAALRILNGSSDWAA